MDEIRSSIHAIYARLIQITARGEKQILIINQAILMFESPTDSQRANAGSLKAAALGFLIHLIGFTLYGLTNRDLTLFQQKERFILYSLILFIALNIVRWAASKRRADLIKTIGYELPHDVAIVAPKSQSSPDKKIRDLGLKYWRGQLAMHFMAGSWAFWICGLFYFFLIKKET